MSNHVLSRDITLFQFLAVRNDCWGWESQKQNKGQKILKGSGYTKDFIFGYFTLKLEYELSRQLPGHLPLFFVSVSRKRKYRKASHVTKSER